MSPFVTTKEVKLKVLSDLSRLVNCLSDFENLTDLSLYTTHPCYDYTPSDFLENMEPILRQLKRFTFFGRSRIFNSEFMSKISGLIELEYLKLVSMTASTNQPFEEWCPHLSTMTSLRSLSLHQHTHETTKKVCKSWILKAPFKEVSEFQAFSTVMLLLPKLEEVTMEGLIGNPLKFRELFYNLDPKTAFPRLAKFEVFTSRGFKDV